MKQFYKTKFSLTNKGAEDLTRATRASFLVFVINMFPPFLLMLLIDQLLLNHTKSPYLYGGIAILTLGLMYYLLSKEYEYLYNSTYQESANLRIQIAEDLSDLPLSYFSKHNLSDLSQTIMSDVEGLEHAMSHSIPKAGGLAIFLPIMSILLLIGNWQMGLAVIIPTAISFMMIPLSKKTQVKGNQKYHSVLRDNSEKFQETIELQQEIKSFNMSEQVKQELYQTMEESEKIHLKTELNTFYTMTISTIFSFVSLGIVILVGIHLMLKGEITILFVLGYLLAAIKIKDTVEAAKESILEIFYLDPKLKRIKEIKETKVQEGKEVDLKTFDIKLNNVSFAYDQAIPVLKNVSFTANQGEVTALVGASGCGKTSILRLVSRLYDYDSGEILIDNHDIKTISTDSLFKNISIVFQDVTLFNTSIMENIRIGGHNATDEEVLAAARLANCDEFIQKLPQGYETLIGENGSELSGGQRQRLSIARAFLKDAPILILDEITASLDVENEKIIQESLNRLISDKTVLIISHRLKAIENVDKIIVMDQGRVESQGTHDSLRKESQVYQNLIEKTRLAEEFVY